MWNVKCGMFGQHQIESNSDHATVIIQHVSFPLRLKTRLDASCDSDNSKFHISHSAFSPRLPTQNPELKTQNFFAMISRGSDISNSTFLISHSPFDSSLPALLRLFSLA